MEHHVMSLFYLFNSRIDAAMKRLNNRAEKFRPDGRTSGHTVPRYVTLLRYVIRQGEAGAGASAGDGAGTDR